MRIGHYVSVIACKRGFERNVSGHVQIPLRSIDLLMQAGETCCLLTQAFTEDRPAVPFCMPRGLTLHPVTDGRKRKKVVDGIGGHAKGLKIGGLIRQARDIVRIAREQQLDVLHFHGYYRTALLAGALPYFGLKIPTVVTLFGPKFGGGLPRPIANRLLKRIGRIVTATDFVAGRCSGAGFPATVVRHGVIRELKKELAEISDGGGPVRPKHRVLFWRDPSVENGCDVVLRVYQELAPRFPDVVFTLAVRPHWDEVPGIDEAARTHPNIEVHRFPYPTGMSLPRLIAESLCILMPIREMSIDPQLVIAESLAAGVPVIATDQRSNNEMVTEGKSGALVAVGDVAGTAEALSRLLSDRTRLFEMGRFAERDIPERWNWEGYVAGIKRVYEEVSARSHK